MAGGYIYTSSDSGVTWTGQVLAGSRTWVGIASSEDGVEIVAIVQNGYIYTSSDSGVTWAVQLNAGSRSWTSVASSADGTSPVASVYGGYIYTTTVIPLVFNIQTQLTSSSATISFSTDEETTTQIAYGTTVGVYTSTTTISSSPSTSHQVTLTGLQPETQYHYVIVSTGQNYSSNYVSNLITSLSVLTTYNGTTILYGADGTGQNSGVQLYTINPDTGAILSIIGPTGHNINGMDFHPTTGVLYGITSQDPDGNKPKSLFTINPDTAETTYLGTIKNAQGTSFGFPDIAFRDNGVLYARGTWNNDPYLFTISTECSANTCLATPVAGVEVGEGGGGGIDFDSEGNLYVFEYEGSSYELNKVDPDTGLIISTIPYINKSPEERVMTSAKFNGVDTLYATRMNWGRNPADLVIINVNTGLIVSISGDQSIYKDMTALAFKLTPTVPTTASAPVQTSGPTAVSAPTLSQAEIQRIFGDYLNPKATTTQPIQGCAGTNVFSIVTGQRCPVAGSGIGTNTNTSTSPQSFTRNIQVGSTGSDVRQLQIFLNNNGFTVATSGGGSKGNETTLFGPATRRALIRYQQANKITPAVGYFGPVTRGIVNGE